MRAMEGDGGGKQRDDEGEGLAPGQSRDRLIPFWAQDLLRLQSLSDEVVSASWDFVQNTCPFVPLSSRELSINYNSRINDFSISSWYQLMAAVAMEAPSHSPSLQSAPSPEQTGRRRHSDLSLDLSDLPALSQPSPPSNTLLITNLQAPEIFASANLESIHHAIQDYASVYAFSPLKSLRRIICTFYTVDDAINIRTALDGETVLGSRVRVYFGAETKIDPQDLHLRAPQSQKQFFISPPPSPPMGWEMRDEEPPNKEVHAEDLASALSKLNARPGPADAVLNDFSSSSPAAAERSGEISQPVTTGRARSATGSVVVYDPQDHGHSPDLPAIAVEDTSVSPVGDLSPMEDVEKKFVHTARPPVELMES